MVTPLSSVEQIDNLQAQQAEPFHGNADIPPAREQVLRELLDGPYRPYFYCNYDDAVRMGLVDLFYYDPKTGYDGLVHILSGNKIWGENGASIVEGFHHEPSGGFGPWGMGESIVHREHLETANSKKKDNYAEHFGEPYKARVSIDGLHKVTTRHNQVTGEEEVVPVDNSMFPKEYDALGVLQAVRMALQTRDKSKDQISERNGLIVTEGTSIMLDGHSRMRIRLILDPNNEKVISAMPLTERKSVMNLDEDSFYAMLAKEAGIGIAIEK